MQKANVKKSRRHLWSEDEIELLKKLYPGGGAREIAKRTGHPLASVRQQAYNMGITTKQYRTIEKQ